MSPKLTRLVLAASMAAGFAVAPMLGAHAAQTSYVFMEESTLTGGTMDRGVHVSDVSPGSTIVWHVNQGEHEIVPKSGEPKEGGGTYSTWPKTDFPEKMGSGDEHSVQFPNAGQYFYICALHPGTMRGVVDVKDQQPATSSTTTTTAAPTTTTTTRVPMPGPTTTTTAAPAGPAGVKPPTAAAPAPTTTTSKDKKKDGKDKKEEETTTTTVPPPPPIDLPDSAIIPAIPDFSGTTTQNGIEAPDGTPEGDAIALLKSKKGGGDKAMKLLIVSGLGLGALGIGTAGYKYANRSSKYFPA